MPVAVLAPAVDDVAATITGSCDELDEIADPLPLEAAEVAEDADEAFEVAALLAEEAAAEEQPEMHPFATRQ